MAKVNLHRVRVVAVGAALGLLLAGITSVASGAATRTASGASAPARALATNKTVVYIEPNLAAPYWDYDAWGVEHAAAAAGYTVKVLDDNSDAEQQTANAKLAISEHVAGIIISPTDSISDVSVLKLAAAAHIPVVIDFIGAESGTYASFVTSADYNEGVADGSLMCNLVPHGSKVIIESLALTRENAVKKNNGFHEAAAKCGLQIVADTQGNTDTIAEAEGEISAMLAAHRGVKGIFAMYDDAGLGAVAALRQDNIAPGKAVKIISQDGSPQSIADVLSGEINGVSVQEASGGGEECFSLLLKAIEGKSVPRLVELPEPMITLANYPKFGPWIETHIWEPGNHTIKVGPYTITYGG